MKHLRMTFNSFWLLSLFCILQIDLVNSQISDIDIDTEDQIITQPDVEEKPYEDISFSPDEEEEILLLEPEIPLPGEAPQIGLTFNIPVIGQVTLYPEKDPATGVTSLKAQLNKHLSLLPLPVIIDEGSISLKQGKKVTLSARATVLGKAARLSLEQIKPEGELQAEPIKEKTTGPNKKLNLNIGAVTLLATFIDKPTLTLLPGKKIKLHSASITLEKGKPATLSSKITLFKQEANIHFTFSKTHLTLNFSIPTVSLDELVPEIANTSLKGIVFKQIDFATTTLITQGKEQLEKAETFAQNESNVSEPEAITTFKGQADFSALNLKDLGLALENLQVIASASKKKGYHFEAIVNNLTLPILGKVQNTKFVFDSSRSVAAQKGITPEQLKAIKEAAGQAKEQTEKQKAVTNEQTSESKKETTAEDKKIQVPTASFALIGNGTMMIPQVGQMAYNLEAKYADKGFIFEGKMNQEVPYKDILLHEATFNLNTKEKVLSITGNTNITLPNVSPLTVKATLQYLPNSPKPIVFSGSTQAQTIEPFKEIPGLPEVIKAITFTQIQAGIDASKEKAGLAGAIYLQGVLTVLDTPFKGTLKIASMPNANDPSKITTGIIAKTETIKDWSFNGKLDVLNKVPFLNASFTASNIDYIEPETQIEVKKGLNFSAQFGMVGALESLGKVLNFPQGKLFTIYGSINPAILSECILGAQIVPNIPLKTDKGANISTVNLGPVSLKITGAPSFDINGRINVKPSPKDEQLNFLIMSKVSTTALEFTSGVKGLWNNPFGLNGFSVGNLGINLGLNYNTFPIPSKLGLAGTIKLSDSHIVSVAGQFDAAFKDMAIYGSISQISLIEIIEFIAKKLGSNIPTKDIPNLSLKDAEIKFAPTQVMIADVAIPKGITLRGQVDILDKVGVLDINVDISGIKAIGCISKIDLGPLHITKSKEESTKTESTSTVICPAQGRANVCTQNGCLERVDKKASANHIEMRKKACEALQDGPILDIELNTRQDSKFLLRVP